MFSQMSLNFNSDQVHDEVCKQYGRHMPISRRGVELGSLKHLYLSTDETD